jgi:hypothetical protein
MIPFIGREKNDEKKNHIIERIYRFSFFHRAVCNYTSTYKIL